MNKEDEPKIIVDDDWKAQVEREKEQLATSGTPDAERAHPIPEASLALLVTTLATQSLAALGFIADPAAESDAPNLPMAKHFIDTLAVLQVKTAGNLDDDESQLLNESLHQLRMAYVTAGKAGPLHSMAQTPAGKSTIELP